MNSPFAAREPATAGTGASSRPRLISRLLGFAPFLLACCAYALFVFYGRGGAFPPGLNHDASWHALMAFRILNGESLGIYTPEAYGHETPYLYFMAGVFRLFGYSKDTIELTATFFGWLAMGLFFWILQRKTGNSWLALALSCLWISSSAFVLFSRVGWQLITLIPAALWVAASCRFYFDEPARARFWALQIALSAGVTLYTYNGGRAILAFVPLFWLFRILQMRGQTRGARRVWIDAALSLLLFFAICAPMLNYAAHHPQEWNGRAASLMTDGGGLAGKFDNLKGALGYYNFSARGDDFFTNFPVLEGPMLLLWAAGLVFACVRLRNYWPELLLFSLFLLPSVVTKPGFHRAIGTLPMLYLLACYGLIALGNWAKKRWQSPATKPVLAAALTLIVALQMGAGWKKLYVDKQPFAWGFYPETTVVGRYLHAHPDTQFALYAGNWPTDALKFLATTDTRNVGVNFVAHNYQSYNTPSGDGLPEIERALGDDTLARPAHIIVDVAKIAAFNAALSARYLVTDEGALTLDGAPVAHVMRVN